ncbi:MAG: 7,8-didemethyl-8-hydroxy-5-deazariboflavin synthase subunit CofG, partial [Cyanobacteriota bacterium]|nr:7,8-didemethyl-8-hydroxy-5-deazariboflavin synthase subunit CofG [Cyanobacteriota bacterium]
MSAIITYSSAYTLVPTYECFNRCSYCNFRTDPGDSPWLSLADARQ